MKPTVSRSHDSSMRQAAFCALESSGSTTLPVKYYRLTISQPNRITHWQTAAP